MTCKLTALLEYLDLLQNNNFHASKKFLYDFCMQNLFYNENKANHGNIQQQYLVDFQRFR